jgi:hypothetical protein
MAIRIKIFTARYNLRRIQAIQSFQKRKFMKKVDSILTEWQIILFIRRCILYQIQSLQSFQGRITLKNGKNIPTIWQEHGTYLHSDIEHSDSVSASDEMPSLDSSSDGEAHSNTKSDSD